jgi:hypothetical protein
MGGASERSIAHFAFSKSKTPTAIRGIEIAHQGIEKQAVNGYNAAMLSVVSSAGRY